MEKEIKINNSKLKIVPLKFKTGDIEIAITNKSELKYQFIVLINDNFSDKKISTFKYISTFGIKKIYLNPIISNNYTECWSLQYEKGISDYSGETYSDKELKIILSFLYLVSFDYQDTSEILSLCTKDERIISKFYSSYGKKGLEEFKSLIKEAIKNPKYKPIESKKTYPLNYLRDKYSIQSLISDLISDGASIYTDKYILKKEIKTIGMKKIDTSEYAISKPDSWYKVTGIVGNKTRANLSLRYNKKVLVSIPENPYDIKPGLTEFDSINSLCLIKDGLLWQDLLGVKVSPKLAGKLKRLKVVKSELFPNSGEYLIDLSTIPVVSKSKIREITSSSLSKLEVNSLLNKIALDYINFIYPEKIEKTDKELFLESLGIKKGYYYPLQKINDPINESYETVELICNVSGFPKTSSEREKIFKNHVESKSHSISNLEDFLTIIDNKIEKEGLKKVKKEYIENDNITNNSLRNLKFQIIMSKNSRFIEKNYPYIDSITKKVILPTISGEKSVQVSWEFKVKKISL